MSEPKNLHDTQVALIRAIRTEVGRMDMVGLVTLALALNLKIPMLTMVAGALVVDDSNRANKLTSAYRYPAASGRVFHGSGMGRLVSETEGRLLLDAVTIDHEAADWVESDLAAAGEVVNLLNISRSTLDNWRRASKVIALRKGLRNFLYPLRQFEHCRPLTGLDRVAALFASPEDAWEWLVAPNRMTDGEPPIEKLRDGKFQMVRNAAEGALDYA